MGDILRRGVALFLALLLLGLFVWGGSQPQAIGLFKEPWDKLAHVTLFTSLAGLLVLALKKPGRRILFLVILACMALGFWDEWRQITLPGRNFGLDDFLANGVGITLGVFLAIWLQRSKM